MEAIASRQLIVANRLAKSTPELDSAELAWWQRFSSLEEQYCWVQTPKIQRFLRGSYVQRVARLAQGRSSVLELGTGVGWLALLLAKDGVGRVTGIDFSEAQIARARNEAKLQNLASRTEFIVCSPADLIAQDKKYGVIVMHGFLHHLSGEEIIATLSEVKHLLTQDGRLVIWEPVRDPKANATRLTLIVFNILSFLQELPRWAFKRGLRRVSNSESEMRRLISERSQGVNPLGPSPKEAPFEPDNLRELLEREFVIHKRTRCMAVSHLVAQDFLLMQLTYPRLAPILMWPILALARGLELVLLKSSELPSSVWSFEMFECGLPSKE